MEKIDKILKTIWGYDSFRPLQREIIESVISGRDTVALLPTGGGKSLTYQVPALAMEGLTIVITPLIALMKDQVDVLRSRGVRAVAINSSMEYRQIDIALDNCVYGDVKLLYIAPERINTTIFRARLQKMVVSLIAIDEAHCISQWGYDFRPSYLQIKYLREVMPDVPMLAVTATATAAVLQDVTQQLNLIEATVFRASFERPNLAMVVRQSENKYDHILRIVRGVPTGSGIIYCRTRNETQKVARLLTDQGISADFYHAGLGFHVRASRQQAFMNGQRRVMVATNAFGMGIDKSDVRFVIHHQMPDSLEAYYQEAGRAGRDGARSYAVLLFDSGDQRAAAQRISMEYPPLEKIREVYDAIFNFLQISIGGGRHESYDFNLEKFAAQFKIYTLTAYNAIKILELNGYMTLTDEMDNPTRILFRVRRDELYKIKIETAGLDGFLGTLLRAYSGFFADYVAIDEGYLAQLSGYTEQRIVEFLLQLSRMKVIRYIPRRRSPMLIFEQERLPLADMTISSESYTRRRELQEIKSSAIVEYATQQTQCRSVQIRKYFDDSQASPCGICDVCIERRQTGLYDSNAAFERLEREIIELLSGDDSLDIHSLVARISAPKSLVIDAIRHGLESGKILQSHGGGLSLIKS